MTIKTQKTAAELMGCNDNQVNDYLQNILFGNLIAQGHQPNLYDYLRIVRFIEQVQLNPLDRTMYVRYGETGFEPCLRVDGWLSIGRKIGVNSIEHEYSEELISFTGMHPDVKAHVWIKTTITTNDGGEYSHREYVAENLCQNSSWMTMPNRLNGHKSLVQTMRLATGIYSAGDEFDSVDTPAATVKPLTVDVDIEANAEGAKVDVTPEMEKQEPKAPAETPEQVETPSTIVAETDAEAETPEQVEAPSTIVAETDAEAETPEQVETPSAIAAETDAEAETPEQVETPSAIVAETDAEAESNVQEPAVKEAPVTTNANPATAKTMKEVLQTQVDGYTPTRKVIGDLTVALERCQAINAWKNIRAYIETTRSWNEQERQWAMTVFNIWADVCGASL